MTLIRFASKQMANVLHVHIFCKVSQIHHSERLPSNCFCVIATKWPSRPRRISVLMFGHVFFARICASQFLVRRYLVICKSPHVLPSTNLVLKQRSSKSCCLTDKPSACTFQLARGAYCMRWRTSRLSIGGQPSRNLPSSPFLHFRRIPNLLQWSTCPLLQDCMLFCRSRRIRPMLLGSVGAACAVLR